MTKLIYIVIAAVVLVAVYFTVLGMISRSGKAPGLIDGKLAPCGKKPNAVCSENDPDTAHYVAPLKTDRSSLEGIASIIEQMQGKVSINSPDYIAAEFRSALFGFIDDVELRMDPELQVIHIRSASRVGYSDLGVNRDRVIQLRNLIESEQ